MKTVLASPVCHFLVLGAVLLGIQWLGQQYQALEVTAPSADEISALSRQWQRDHGGPLAAVPTAQLVAAEIDRRILLAEAIRLGWHRKDPVVVRRLLQDATFLGLDGPPADRLAAAVGMNLHRDDPVIRRRLEQRMRALAAGEIGTPDDAELQAHYRQYPERWTRPEQWRISQIFVAAPRAEQKAMTLLEQLRTDKLAAEAANTHGSPFLTGPDPGWMDADRMAKWFGSTLTRSFQAKPWTIHSWNGPYPSRAGAHLFWLHAHKPAQTAALASVREQVRQDWIKTRELAAIDQFLSRLRTWYRLERPTQAPDLSTL